MAHDVDAALAAIRARDNRRPHVALVLGSGLGALADELEEAESIPAGDVPGYPASTVVGHAGRLVLGRLEGHDVLAIQGRPHLYEGHEPEAVTFPVRLAHALGARRLLLTNAAGGVNPAFGPATLMLITDHLGLTGAGAFRPTARGPAVSRCRPRIFDSAWIESAERVATERGIPVRRGVYAWTAGPSYETPAEIRFFRFAGADAVGMSTVPEALAAGALGMAVLGISAITNAAAGITGAPLDHAEVLDVGRRVRAELASLVRGVVDATPAA